MKKSKLTFLFVTVLASFVPQIAWSQANPGAKAESTAANPAAASKQTARKSTEPIQLATDAPTTYVVVKGDTLWDISGRFLKEPWRWPEIWNMNREEIKNPHWIYPGDVIKLSFDANGNPMLSLASRTGGLGGDDARLQPKIRVDVLGQAIPSIPSRVISPFLSLPLVVEEGALGNAPRIIATDDNRVVIGAGNIAYALGLQQSQGTKWQIYRPGKALKNGVGEVLGFEANYLGEAKVSRFGEASTIEILRSTQEITLGDRLTPTADTAVPSYSPRSPDKNLSGAIISVLNGVDTSAQYSVVTLDLGKRDGIEVGHVLAVLRKGSVVSTTDPIGQANKYTSTAPEAANLSGNTVKLPDERNGLVFVFRVFEKVSYALVMATRRPTQLGDVVQTP